MAFGVRDEVKYTYERDRRTTSWYYCTKNPHSIAYQKIMCILDRYYLPENPNIFLFNQRKFRRPDDRSVSASRSITVVGYVHAYSLKIICAPKSASTMMDEYVPTSIWLYYLVLLSVILFDSVWNCLILCLKLYPLWILL